MATTRFISRTRVRDLRRLPIFTGCTTRQLRRIASVTTELHIEAGRELTALGRTGTEFFVIVSGLASVRRDGVQIDELEAGSFFGEVALLDRGGRTATVTADTDMRLLVLTRREFLSTQFFVPAVAEQMLGVMTDRLRRALEAPAVRPVERAEPARLDVAALAF
jgi:CRP-like cAMP-binding protein